MKIFTPTRIQWLTALFPLPLVVWFFLYLLIDFSQYDDEHTWHVVVFFTPVSFLCWYTCVLINNLITRFYPHQSQTFRRAAALFGIHTVWLCILILLVFNGTDIQDFSGIRFKKDNMLSAAFTGVVFNIIFCIIWQVEYIFESWKSSLAEKEKAEQQMLQQEFDLLKQQINPHFLFNNLNVLSSLIAQNPQKASYYLDELSKVYRYLLRRGHDDVSTLREELAFIDSYTALLKIRFGNAMHIRVDAKAACKDRLLPTLSLQLLVENAIKHNIASKEEPLYITITVLDERLLVTNNLQRKGSTVSSNKVGLTNLQTKYRLLNMESIFVEQSSHEYRVELPLVKSIHYYNTSES